jgi:hypothetical protein
MELAQPEPLLQLASYLCVKTASLWLRLARAVSNSVLCKLARNRTCCAAVSTAVPRCSPVGGLLGGRSEERLRCLSLHATRRPAQRVRHSRFLDRHAQGVHPQDVLAGLTEASHQRQEGPR